MSNKILVTGGAGYIGSHTLIELIEAGYTPICVDNFSNSNPDRLARVKTITGVSVVNYAIDLCDKSAVEQVISAHPDLRGIIHFAAYMSVEESVALPLKYYHNNLESIVNLLEIANKYTIPNFVYSSSCSVYGNVATSPVSEQTPLQPAASPYANTKLIGEQIIQDFARNTQMNFILLRYFNPVGAHISGQNGEYPSQKPFNLLPIVVEVAAGIRKQLTVFGTDYSSKDGTCVRDYIHVSDIARAHINAIAYLQEQKNSEQVEIFNLGSGEGVTVQEILDAFEKVNEVKLSYQYGERRAGDVGIIYADNSWAKARLGWEPRLGIEEMMRSAWLWQQELMKHPS